MNSNQDQNPWGDKDKNSGNQGPPDLEELLDKWRSGVGGLFNKPNNRKQSGSGNSNGGQPPKNNSGSGGFTLPTTALILAAIALIGIIWVMSGFYIINEQERGVVLRFGKYHSELFPGLRWQPPLIDDVTRINQTRVRDQNFRGDMLTEDENIVQITLQVQYKIGSGKDFVLNVRNPEQSLGVATDSALRHVVGSSTLDDVITSGRARIASSIRERVQQYLDTYGTGLEIRGVNILEAKPPDPVKPAFDDVIKAREDKVRVVNEATAYANGIVPEARGQAQRIIEDARGYKESVIARAKGEANRFVQILSEYEKAPVIMTRRLYLDTMQQVFSSTSKIVIDTKNGSNNMLYIPLDQIMRQGGRSISSGSSSNSPVSAGSLSNSEVEFLTDRIVDELRSRQRSANPTISPQSQQR